MNKLLDYSLTTQCPSAQSEVIGGSVVKLLTRLLQSKDKNPSLNQCLGQLQAEVTETLICSLEDMTEQKVSQLLTQTELLCSLFKLVFLKMNARCVFDDNAQI